MKNGEKEERKAQVYNKSQRDQEGEIRGDERTGNTRRISATFLKFDRNMEMVRFLN